jgi:hypothetical protein
MELQKGNVKKISFRLQKIPIFHLNADLDPGSQTNADPSGQTPTSQKV